MSDLQQKVSYLPDIHRLLPQDQMAEKGVLSSFLLDPVRVGRICAEFEISAGHFHLPAHAAIFDEIQFLHGERMPCDFITITGNFRNRGQLEKVGGAAFITELFTFLPTAANVGYYIDILQEKHWLRCAIRDATELAARCYDEQDNVAKLKELTQKKLLALCQTSRRRERHNPGAIAERIFEKWQKCDTQALFGVSTGIQALDAEIGGVAKGDLIIIMGPTSSGKSALAQLIMLNFLKRGERVMDVTFEMTAEQRISRCMQMLAQRNLRQTMRREREFEDPVEKAFACAVETIKGFKLEIMDDRGSNIRQVCATARNLHSEAPFGLVAIDYDELVKGERSKGASKEEEVASISSLSKTLAGELACPVILLSQQTVVNGVAKVRWSTAKQNDAQVLLAIRTEDDGKTATVEILKNREGRRGAEITFDFDGPTTTFKERP